MPETGAPAPLTRRRALGVSAVLAVRLVALAVSATLALTAAALVLAVVGLWLFPPALRLVRSQAEGVAREQFDATGLRIWIPELPNQPSRSFTARVESVLGLLRSPAVWRLLAASLVDGCVGLVIAVMPLALLVEGILTVPRFLLLLPFPDEFWGLADYLSGHLSPVAGLVTAVVLTAVLLYVGIGTAPWWIRVHGRFAAALFGSDAQHLQREVDRLTASRAEARQDAAAELLRIEREVHDATQSQLVAIGLKLGTAELLFDDDPTRARTLLAEAREDSSTALTDLRGLMRGIRPQILADRGLGAALESLALEADTTVTADVRLPDRLDPTLESAVYFAVRELTGNALKHAGARRVRIRAWTERGSLIVIVADDGTGGATLVPGHGLDGARRRLSAFDGTLSVHSPAGGPSEIRIEAPCAS